MSNAPEVAVLTADTAAAGANLSGVSSAEKCFVRGGFLANCRTDGRHCDEYRQLQVATSVIPSAFGSARVRNEECDVVCVIKADLCGPSLTNPHEGKIAVDVQFASNASADIQLHLSLDDSKTANQRLGYALLTGPLSYQFVPRDAFVVVKNRFVWKITVDIMILNLGGSLLDVTSAALVAALRTTLLPKIRVILEDENVYEGEDDGEEAGVLEDDDIDVDLEVLDAIEDSEEKSDKTSRTSVADDGFYDLRILHLAKQISFDVDSHFVGTPFPHVDRIPLLVSIGQVEGRVVCDLTAEERLAVHTIIIALINKDGDLLGLRKEGGIPVAMGLLTTLGPALRQTGILLYTSLTDVCSRTEAGKGERRSIYSWCTDMKQL